MVFNGGHNLKASLGVKLGRLKTERHEYNLAARPPPSLLLCCLKQPGSQALLTPRLFDPELADFHRAAPTISANPRNNLIALIPHENREPLAIGNARRLGVEFIDAILQVLYLVQPRLFRDGEFGVWHSRHVQQSAKAVAHNPTDS